MSETEHALELLARLNTSDRGWIVERLSDAAKARLMGLSDADAPPAAKASASTGRGEAASAARTSANAERGEAAPATEASANAERNATERVIERLCGADLDRLCAALRSEPSWLVCALLRAHDWPWSKDVLHALLPSTRAEIARLERQGTTLAPPAMEVLLKQLAERVGAPTGGYVPPSRFEQVLTRLRRLRHA